MAQRISLQDFQLGCIHTLFQGGFPWLDSIRMITENAREAKMLHAWWVSLSLKDNIQINSTDYNLDSILDKTFSLQNNKVIIL